MEQDAINERIRYLIGSLIIDNEALRLELAAVKRRLDNQRDARAQDDPPGLGLPTDLS